MIEVDGSFGEGGGQILRTSLALSMVTGRPVRIENIRAGRPKPGLLRQHLTAVRAAQEVCDAEVTGDELGSTSVSFDPGPVRAGAYSFSIGTAGSTTLVLQTILPALMTASGPSSVELGGGTHNIYAPSVCFLNRTYLPVLKRAGPGVSLELYRPGFYPGGGGRLRADITPSTEIRPIELLDRGEVLETRARACVAGLSPEIAKRELHVVKQALGWDGDQLVVEELDGRVGPGNILTLEIASETITEVVTGFGRRGASAERVASEASKEAARYLAHGAPVGEYLADQLLIPMALAGDGVFRTEPLSRHTKTNIEVIQKFLEVRFQVAEHEHTCSVEAQSA